MVRSIVIALALTTALAITATAGAVATAQGAGTDATNGSAAGADEPVADDAAIDAIERDIDAVVEHHRDGDTEEARRLLNETYHQRFLPIAGQLNETRPWLARDLDEDLTTDLGNMLRRNASMPRVAGEAASMEPKLANARTALAGSEDDGQGGGDGRDGAGADSPGDDGDDGDEAGSDDGSEAVPGFTPVAALLAALAAVGAVRHGIRG